MISYMNIDYFIFLPNVLEFSKAYYGIFSFLGTIVVSFFSVD